MVVKRYAMAAMAMTVVSCGALSADEGYECGAVQALRPMVITAEMEAERKQVMREVVYRLKMSERVEAFMIEKINACERPTSGLAPAPQVGKKTRVFRAARPEDQWMVIPLAEQAMHALNQSTRHWDQSIWRTGDIINISQRDAARMCLEGGYAAWQTADIKCLISVPVAHALADICWNIAWKVEDSVWHICQSTCWDSKFDEIVREIHDIQH